MESGIGGAFRELQSAVEGVAIAFGERLAPTIKLAAEKITELANRFAALSPKTQDMIIKIAAIASVVGPALLVFGKLTTGVGSLMKVFGPLFKILGGAKNATGALSIAFKALTGPVGIIAAVIGVVIAVMMRLYKTNAAFRDKINGIWAQITAAFQKVQERSCSAWPRMAPTGAADACAQATSLRRLRTRSWRARRPRCWKCLTSSPQPHWLEPCSLPPLS
jgi:phage-related protein